MAANVTVKGDLPIKQFAKSQALAEQLKPFAQDVFYSVDRDSNKEFTSTLRVKQRISSGRLGRISWQIGAAPKIGRRVEAKRGVFARAIAAAGLKVKVNR